MEHLTVDVPWYVEDDEGDGYAQGGVETFAIAPLIHQEVWEELASYFAMRRAAEAGQVAHMPSVPAMSNMTVCVAKRDRERWSALIHDKTRFVNPLEAFGLMMPAIGQRVSGQRPTMLPSVSPPGESPTPTGSTDGARPVALPHPTTPAAG